MKKLNIIICITFITICNQTLTMFRLPNAKIVKSNRISKQSELNLNQKETLYPILANKQFGINRNDFCSAKKNKQEFYQVAQKTKFQDHSIRKIDFSKITSELVNLAPTNVEDICQLLDKGAIRSFCKVIIDSPPSWSKTTWRVEWLPGWIIKTGCDRIKGSTLLEECIEQYNLNLIRIPRQKNYQVPRERINDISGNEIVPDILCISEYIEGEFNLPINLEQAKQLIILMLITGYWDAKKENIVHCSDGTLGIIDSEDKGFIWYYDDNFWKKVHPGGIMPSDDPLGRLLNKNEFTPDAKEYVQSIRLKYRKI